MTTNLDSRDEPGPHDDLYRRVDQLEKALMAVATDKMVCLDKNGRLMPAPVALPNGDS